jgi:hypothetical protein
MRGIQFATIFGCILAIAGAPAAQADVFGSPAAGDAGSAASGQYLVKFVAGTSQAEQDAALAAAGATDLDYIAPLRLHSVVIAADDPQPALDSLSSNPSVARVEAEQTRAATSTPSDPDFPSQWSLQTIGWNELYGSITPVGSATVAVLDTGVDASHADLAANVLPGTSILDSGSSGTTDSNGHGTQMAGIVAASTDNGEGIAGIGYAGVNVMPVTVLDSNGVGQDGDIINGVIWAADHGADVILMAFSSPDFSPSLQEAIDYAWSQGAVLVGATGNDGSPAPHFPAGDRGVVGVANTDVSDALNDSSNYGDAAFMAAPGTGIQTTANGGGYTTITGTSASAAEVAGAAALLKANDSAASNGVIVGRLARNAEPAGAGTGNGRLNLARTANDTATDPVEPAGSAPVGAGGPIVGPYVAAAIVLAPTSGQAGTVGSITGGGWPNGGGARTATVKWDDGSTIGTCSVNNGGNITGACSFTVPAAAAPGAHTVTMTVASAPANDQTATFTVVGPPAKLAFVQQPTDVSFLAPITPAVTVEVQDAAGTRITSGTGSTASISMAIGTNPGAATLGGTTTRTAAAGLATFNDLTLNSVANGYTLAASSSGLTGATSNTFNVTPGTCTSLTSGVWNQAARWSCARIPTANDNVNIANSHAVTIDTGVSAVARSVTINSNAGNNQTSLSLTAANAVLNVGTDVRLQRPTATNLTNLNVNAGTVNVGGNLTLDGNDTTTGRNNRVAISTGTLDIGGNLAFVTGAVAARASQNVVDMTSGAGTLNLAGSFNVNNTGASLSQGTFVSSSTSTVNFDGAAAQTIPVGVASVTYNNLHTNNTSSAGATPSAAITSANVTGNVRVQTGTFNTGGFNHGGGVGDTFQVANGAIMLVSGGGTGPSGFSNVTYGDTSTVNYNGSGQTVAGGSGGSYGHLILSGTGEKLAGGAISVRGDWTLQSGPTFNPAGGTVTFTGGAATQTIGGSQQTNFNNLTIDKSLGSVAISRDTRVDGQLTFTQGNITTGSNVLISTNAAITHTSGHVVGNLRRSIPSGAESTVRFDVGGTSAYTPASLTFHNVTSGAGTVTASTTAGDHPQLASAGILANKSVNRYWTLTPGNSLAFGDYDAAFTFVDGDKDAGVDTSKFVVRRFDGTNWHATTAGTRAANSTQATGITSMSDFAIGEADEAGPVTSNVAVAPSPAKTPPTVTATVSDTTTGGSTVSAAEYYIDSLSNPATPMNAADGTFDAVTENVTKAIPVADFNALADGEHTVYVRGQDRWGNWGTAVSTTFVKDTTGPTSAIAFPANSGAYNTAGWNAGCATPGICGTASDGATGSGVASVHVSIKRDDDTYWDGLGWSAGPENFIPATGTTTWSYALPASALTDGHSYTVRAESTDSVGTTGAATSSTFTYDTASPTVTVNQAVGQDDPTDEQPVHFTAVFSEPVTGFGDDVGDVQLGGSGEHDSATALVTHTGGNTYDIAVSGLGDGNITASVPAGAADDAAGNGNAASTNGDVTVQVDQTDPDSEASSPAYSNADDSSIRVDYTAFDHEPGTGVANVDLYVKEPGGAWELYANDAGADAGYFDYVLDAGAPDGRYGFYTIATDGVGNEEAAPVGEDSFTVVADDTTLRDTVAPAPLLENPPSLTNDPTPTISGTAGKLTETDEHSADVSHVTVRVLDDGDVMVHENTSVPVDPDTGAFTWDSGTLADGDYTAYVSQNDVAGNTGSDTLDFTVDATAPDVTVETADGQEDPTADQPIQFTAEFTEDVTGFGDEVGDVVLGGTAGNDDATVVVTQVDGDTYDIAVSGIDPDGKVTASIPADSGQDAAGNGNAESTSEDNEVQLDTTPPASEAISPPFSNASEDAIHVQYTASDPEPGTGVSAVDLYVKEPGGDWQFWATDNAPLFGSFDYPVGAEGTYSFYTIAVDGVGNREAAQEDEITETVVADDTTLRDITAPLVTLTAPPADTKDDTPEIAGTAGIQSEDDTHSADDATVLIEILDDDANLVTDHTATVNGTTGAFSWDSDQLDDGTYTAHASQADAAGNVGFDDREFTVDTLAPDAPHIDTGTDNPTNATTAAFTFTPAEDGGTLQCKLDDAGYETCDTRTSQGYTGLGEGPHSFDVRQVDAAGNDGAADSESWYVDLTTPETAFEDGPPQFTNSTSATFEFSGTDDRSAAEDLTFECSLDDEVSWVPCDSPEDVTGLTDATHSYYVRATDEAGNTDPVPDRYDWTVDTVDPKSKASSPATTNDTASTFEVQYQDATDESSGLDKVELYASKNGGDYDLANTDDAPHATGTFSFEHDGDGTYRFYTIAYDQAGNIEDVPRDEVDDTTIVEDSKTLRDIVAPIVTLTAPPANTNDDTPQIAGTAGTLTATEERSADAGTVKVEVLDDTDTVIQTHNDVPVNSTTGAFSVDADSLADGDYTARTKQRDGAGNEGSDTRAFTVDTGTPDAPTIDTHPDDPTNETTADFTFTPSEDDGTVQCSLDGADYAECETRTSQSYDSLGQGSHTFDVRQVDAAGNDSAPASFTWFVDLTDPNTSIDPPTPPNPDNDATPTFKFSGTDNHTAATSLSFECKVDDGDWTPCTSPKTLTTALADGTHTFYVRATDQAENTDETPAEYTWKVDTAAPDVSLTEPPSLTGDDTPAISGTAGIQASDASHSADDDHVTVEVLDDTDTVIQTHSNVPVNSTTGAFSVNATHLDDGDYTARATQSDGAGNQDTDTRDFTVDTGGPAKPVIDTHPDDPTKQTGATFTFHRSEPGGTLECQLDTGAFEECDSATSQSYTGLTEGPPPHTFYVRQVDDAGNPGTAENFSWFIDRTDPDTSIDSPKPPNPDNDATPTFNFSGTDNHTSPANLSFECQVDNGGWNDCDSPKTLGSLIDGEHTFEVRATDQAGNIDPTPASHTWKIDTGTPAAPAITSPADNSYSSTGTYSVDGTAEAGSTVELFDGATSKGTTTATGGNWSFSLIGVADGSHTYTAKATDAAHNTSGASNSRTVIVDKAKPSSNATGPATASSNTFNVTYTASDASPSSGLQQVELFVKPPGAGSYSSAGTDNTPNDTQSFSYTATNGDGSYAFYTRATDKAGNVEDAPTTPPDITVALTTGPPPVVYNFSGFKAPVDNLPVLNLAKAGSNIPLKFSLGGNKGMAIFADGYPKSQVIPCNSTALVDGIEITDSPGNSSLTYDAATGLYHYNWKTEKNWTLCRQLVMKFADGTTYGRADFKFTK